MAEKYILLFFRHTVNPKFPPQIAEMFQGSYNVGWLSNNLEFPYILKWGNAKDKEKAKQAMAEVLEKQGERPVLFYDKEIQVEKSKSIITLSKEVYQDILDSSEKWH